MDDRQLDDDLARPGASGSSEFPWRGWRNVLRHLYEEIGRDRLLALAAAVAFYSLLALFPAITAAVSLYALFADPGTISSHLSLLAGIIPSAVLNIVGDEITRVAAQSNGKLTFGFVFGLMLALWSANAGMKATFDALNVIYDEAERRGFFRLNLASLLMTFGAVVGMLASVMIVIVFPVVMSFVGLPGNSDAWLHVLRWPVTFVLAVLSLAVLYRYGPSGRKAKRRWFTVGSVFAALAWIAVSSAYSWYLANFANYNATYGALGAVIGLLMWMWLSTVVVFVGAELDCELERATASARPAGSRPLGSCRADMTGVAGPS
jgi:membrane protein